MIVEATGINKSTPCLTISLFDDANKEFIIFAFIISGIEVSKSTIAAISYTTPSEAVWIIFDKIPP